MFSAFCKICFLRSFYSKSGVWRTQGFDDYCNRTFHQKFQNLYIYKHTGCFFFRKVPPRTVLSMELVPLNRITQLDGEMLNGFLLPEEPTSSAFLALSTSSTALTWSTMALLQTLSLPSWHDGLRFRRSSRVPFSRNFFRSLLRISLKQVEEHCGVPMQGQATWLIRMKQDNSVINISIKKIKRNDWVITFEHIPPLSVPDQLPAASAQSGMCAASQSTP